MPGSTCLTNEIRMITMRTTLHYNHNTDDDYTLTQLTLLATITSVANHNITYDTD